MCYNPRCGKNNQPLILGAIAIGAVLIIALALIFTRNSDETTPTTNNTSETQATGNTEEGSEGGQEAGTSECDTQEEEDNNPECWDDESTASPAQRITCVDGGPTYIFESDGSWIDENGVRRTACEAPTTPTGILPSNWNSLTSQEKTNLNPFDCDHEIQWVSAEDGSCINKASERETNVAPEYIPLTESRDCDEPTDFLGEVV